MRIYTYHMKPGATALVDAVAVREGFSWAAFVFGFLWALYHRLWLVAVVVLAVPVLVRYAVDNGWLEPAIASTVLLLFGFYVGCSGNDWRRESLERRGYVLAGITSARDLAEADRRFFDAARMRVTDPASAAALSGRGPSAAFGA
jgi:hypothetical protein